MEDEETISEVATRVKSVNRLRMLTLLTFADLMALSSGRAPPTGNGLCCGSCTVKRFSASKVGTKSCHGQ